MKHYGDITNIKGFEVPLVDIVTGGSPCQDLSVAGKRAGLDGERSGLFMEQIRVIKEMRNESLRQLRMQGADDIRGCIRPRYMVWKTSLEPSVATKEKTSDVSLKKQRGSSIKTPLYLCLTTENGHRPAASWVTGGVLLGEYMMLSFGESPREERESRLSQILEANPHPKYCLSARACQGILNRAERRGKELPPLLRETLLKQSVSKNVPDVRGGKGILIQHERTGALSTFNNQSVLGWITDKSNFNR